MLLLGAAIPPAGYAAFALSRPAPPASGTLIVQTADAAADVLISGEMIGRTPVSIRLAPGSYAVELRTPEAHRTITVDVPSGGTITHHVELPIAPVAAPVANAPLAPGTAPSLPALPPAVAKRAARLTPRGPAPTGLVSINALPWADVWIDGENIGQTPIGNVYRAVGEHQVVLRHPDLGERVETITVAVDRPARLGVDMRRR